MSALLDSIGLSPKESVLADILTEELRQDHRWGAERHFPDGTGRPGDDAKAMMARLKCKANSPATDNWRDILEEEVFEAFAEADPAALRQELVQVAAVAAQWIADLDRSQ